jgi:hypothetical protein
MDNSSLLDELWQIEPEVVARERRLAELEALIAEKNASDWISRKPPGGPAAKLASLLKV